jgi:subtilisin family serine protease
VEVIVDFDFDPDKDKEFDEVIADADYKPWAGHRTKAIKFLNQFQKKYGLERSGMTSWTTTSLTAYVTGKQLDAITRDKRVVLVTENEPQRYSAFFAATDSIVPGTTGESSAWGWKVTTNNTPLLAGASERLVYVIDSGIANHADLNVFKRTNVACGTGAENCSNGTSTDQFPEVGCNPHATHVAGIIGARGGNATTNIGVYAGVKLVSVGAQAATAPNVGICASSRFEVPSNPTLSTIGYAFDWIRKSTLLRVSTLGDTRVPIASMSINSGRIGYDYSGAAETNRSKLLRMVNPAQSVCAPFPYWESKVCAIVNYPGAFFVQSAGNQAVNGNTGFDGRGLDVCTKFIDGVTNNFGASLAYTHAYPNSGTTSNIDGVMVIGAIRPDGAAVDAVAYNGTTVPVPVARQFSPTVPSGLTGTITSSNFGGCLDAWAPGDRIYSTWCQHSAGQSCVVGGSYTGNGQSGTQGWAFLSGTSMAAPHVAGAAAYLADALLLTTPASIEQAVRAKLNGTGYSDQGNNSVKIVQVP